jgi:hypothetical protein
MLGEGYELSSGPRKKINGRETMVVRVKGEQAAAEMYFDAATGLLAGSKRTMQLPLGNREVEGDVTYADYKDVDGIKYPMKVTSTAGGNLKVEVRVAEVQFLDRIDPATFAQP